jgi:hypothetical protein
LVDSPAEFAFLRYNFSILTDSDIYNTPDTIHHDENDDFTAAVPVTTGSSLARGRARYRARR